MTAHWIDAWAQVFLRASWQGGLALLLIWLICSLFRRATPAARCWLWRFGYLKTFAVLLAIAPLSLPLLPGSANQTSGNPPTGSRTSIDLAPAVPAITPPIPRTAAPSSNSFAPLDASNPSPPPTTLAAAFTRTPIANPAPSTPALPAPVPILAHLLFVTWLAGILACGTHMLRAFLRTRILRRTALPANDPALHTLCQALAATLRIRRLPQLLITATDAGPLLTGIFRPAILLPAALLQRATPAQLRLVLAHELAHLKRRDLPWNLLCAGIHTLFFFHPLLWLARRESGYLQELACDQLTLAATQSSPADYSRTLLDILVLQATSRPALLGARVATTASTLRRRILTMKPPTPSSPRRLIMLATTLAIAGTLFILPWRLVAQTAAPSAPPATPAASSNQPPAPAAAAPADLSDKVTTRVFFLPHLIREKPELIGGDTTNKKLIATASDVVDFLRIEKRIGPDLKLVADDKVMSLTITGPSAQVHRLVEYLGFIEYVAALPVPTADRDARFGAGIFGNPSAAEGLFGDTGADQNGAPAPIKDAATAPAPKPDDLPPAVGSYPGDLEVPMAAILSPIDGTLRQVNVKPGQTVKKGDVLFKLDDRAATAALNIAQLDLKNAQLALDAKSKEPAVAAEDLQKCRNQVALEEIHVTIAQNALDDLSIHAPLDGAIQDSVPLPDSPVTRNLELATIAAVSDLQLSFSVPINEAGGFHVGQNFTVLPQTGQLATGELTFISSTVDPQSGVTRLHGKLLSGDHLERFRPGATVEIFIAPDSH